MDTTILIDHWIEIEDEMLGHEHGASTPEEEARSLDACREHILECGECCAVNEACQALDRGTQEGEEAAWFYMHYGVPEDGTYIVLRDRFRGAELLLRVIQEGEAIPTKERYRVGLESADELVRDPQAINDFWPV